jgi:uncharacterized membrane protein YeaQ/YmgE (transglycosylase-associated protein family)
MLLYILIWIFLGIIAGLFVNFIFPLDGKYLPGTIGAGIVGAIIGGILFSIFKIGSIAFAIDPIAAALAIIGSIFLVYFIRILVRVEED